MADAEEIQNFFKAEAEAGQEELMVELDELLAQDAMENMVDAGSSSIPQKGQKIP